MAISFVGSAQNGAAGNAGSLTITLPGGMQVNDLILSFAAVGDTTNNAMGISTGGYTLVTTTSVYSNDVNDTNLDLAYKYHISDTTCVWNTAGGTNAANAAAVMVFRGVALAADGGPFDTAFNQATGINTSNADPPSHDWSGTSGVWTVIGASTGHTGGNAATWTFPTGYTTNAVQRAFDDTIDVLVGMGYNSAPSDPENPGTFSASTIGTAADNAWAAITVSLKEAAAAVESAQFHTSYRSIYTGPTTD